MVGIELFNAQFNNSYRCRGPVSVGKAKIHMNRKRNNLLVWVLKLFYNFRIHRNIGRHPWAWPLFFCTHIRGRLLLILKWDSPIYFIYDKTKIYLHFPHMPFTTRLASSGLNSSGKSISGILYLGRQKVPLHILQ